MSLVVAITGGARGIGKALVEDFLSKGHKVSYCDIGDRWDSGDNPDIFFAKCDVSNEEQVKAWISGTFSHFNRLDCLINNAAISNPYSPSGDPFDVAHWNKVVGINLNGPFYCSKYASEHIRKQAGGSIINISSTRALMSEPNSEAYGATKGGLLSLTHAMAMSLGKDPNPIRVNVICPGWINASGAELTAHDHQFHPVGRVGVPKDISEMCFFLADSSKSGFITGQTFVVDGGVTKKMIYEADFSDVGTK